MSNILNNFSSNADERTELIEYKRIYYVVKYLSPLFFIFLFWLIISQIFSNIHLDINVKSDYLAERFTFYSMIFSFSAYCLTLYAFKVSNLLRFLFYSVVMYFISFGIGIYTGMISSNINQTSGDLGLITYLIVFIPSLIGVGFNLFGQMRGTYAFWSKSDLKHFLTKFSDFLISKDLIDKNTSNKRTPKLYISFSIVASLLLIIVSLVIMFFDPSNTLRIGLDDIIVAPIIAAVLGINVTSLILFGINKTERISLIIPGMFISNNFLLKILRYSMEAVYGYTSKVNIPLQLLSIVVPVLVIIICIRLLRRK